MKQNYAVIINNEILKLYYECIETPQLSDFLINKGAYLLKCPDYVKTYWFYDKETNQFYEFEIPDIEEEII